MNAILARVDRGGKREVTVGGGQPDGWTSNFASRTSCFPCAPYQARRQTTEHPHDRVFTRDPERKPPTSEVHRGRKKMVLWHGRPMSTAGRIL